MSHPSLAFAPAARRRRRLTSALVALLLTGATTAVLTPPQALAAPSGGSSSTVRATVPVAAGSYLSAPPSLPGTGSAAAEPVEPAAAPPPAPTRGHVTGRVLTPTGKPLAQALVQGVRFHDLGPGFNLEEESPVLARTGADGRFRLPQLRERYLIRVCDAGPRAEQCGGEETPDRYAPTYVGPDGVRSSWVTSTRMFSPKTPTRAVGTVKMRRYAVLRGTFEAGPARSVRLLRANGTQADLTRTDASGRYRFRVVPGRYRVEVDRHEGLRTQSTVPGFRSELLTLRTAAATRLDFQSRPAAVVSGLVTENGRPLAEEAVVITDEQGRWAAGVGTDENGRYVVESLRPGRYTVQTTSAFSGFVPQARSVTLTVGEPVRADLELERGGAVEFSLAPLAELGQSGVEIRDTEGFVVKSFRDRLGDRTVGLSGLRDGRYDLYVRGSVGHSDDHDPTKTRHPWTTRRVTITGGQVVELGVLTLDRAQVDLSGTLPRNAQAKITALPLDVALRPDYRNGPRVTSIAVDWLAEAGTDGRYLSRGLVPGRYHVQLTARTVSLPDGSTTYRGNVAHTHRQVVVGDTSSSADFRAPAGGILRGTLRYAGTKRALIAPVGYRVSDRGADSTLLPLVSKSNRRFGQPFRVDRLHAGPVTGRLLDVFALGEKAETDLISIPSSLLSSAPIGEARTPYWLASKARKATVRAGEVTRLGSVEVRVRR